MIDIQLIRENPDIVRAAVAQRGDSAPIDEIIALDAQWRRTVYEVESLRAERNALSKEIGGLTRATKAADTKEAKHAQHRRDDLVARSSFLGRNQEGLEAQLKEIEAQLKRLLLQVPNIADPRVPVGLDEDSDLVLREEGKRRQFGFAAKPHWELGERLGIIDFQRGVKLSGSRFYVLTGAGARLQRALIAFMLDVHLQHHHYSEIYPPFMVKEECMWEGGWLPKFADNMYHDAEEDFWWLPTAEVALTNLHRDEILQPGTLPLRYVAYTPCFRREKMSAGRDVRGLKRGRQFDKVELYKFTQPESSDGELESLVTDAEAVLRLLGLPYRVKLLCTGELGFSSRISYDLDAWAPGCSEWLEVSSCSNCGEFQARRANIRFRRQKGARPEYAHTLNGSGLALPRTLAALLENYQQADGSVLIPEALRPYMGGLEVISI
jgi:seryl-tRNA synthetase